MLMTFLALALALPLALPPGEPAAQPDVLSALETAVVDAIARAEPSIVAISREKAGGGEEPATTAVRGLAPVAAPPPPLNNPFAEAEEEDDVISTDYRSGVVIGPQGAILTAFHVVKGASRLRVRAPGLKHSFDAEVLAASGPDQDLTALAEFAAGVASTE